MVAVLAEQEHALKQELAFLSTEHNALAEEHAGLSQQHRALLAEHRELEEGYEALHAQHEALRAVHELPLLGERRPEEQQHEHPVSTHECGTPDTAAGMRPRAPYGDQDHAPVMTNSPLVDVLGVQEMGRHGQQDEVQQTLL